MVTVRNSFNRKAISTKKTYKTTVINISFEELSQNYVQNALKNLIQFGKQQTAYVWIAYKILGTSKPKQK